MQLPRKNVDVVLSTFQISLNFCFCLSTGCFSSDAVTAIFRETKSMEGEEYENIVMTIHECSLASGSSLICRLVEVMGFRIQ